MGFIRTRTWNHNGTHCGFCGRKIEANESYCTFDGKPCCDACIDAVEAKQKAKDAAEHLAKTKKGGEKDVLKWKKQYEQLGKNISDLEKALRGNDADEIDKCRGRSVSGGAFVQLLRTIFYAPSYLFWVGGLVYGALWAYDHYIAKEEPKEKVTQEVRHVEVENAVSNATTDVVNE